LKTKFVSYLLKTHMPGHKEEYSIATTNIHSCYIGKDFFVRFYVNQCKMQLCRSIRKLYRYLFERMTFFLTLLLWYERHASN